MAKTSNQTPSKRKQLLGVQASYTNSTGGLLSAFRWMPNPDAVLKKNNKSINAYHDIRQDPHVYSCLQSRRSGVLSLEWGIDVGEAQTEQGAFVESVLRKLDMHRVISGILEAVPYGYQPLEIYWREESMRFVIADIVAKPPEWFHFDIHQRLMFRSNKNTDGIACAPLKFITAQHNASYTNPYGDALLSKCFWAVTFKKNAMRFWLRFAEKYGMPYLAGTIPPGAALDDLDELKAILEEMRQDGVIVTESNSEVKIIDASGAASSLLFQALIAHCNAEITRVILSHAGSTEATQARQRHHGERGSPAGD
jgi:phage gp29-like protein